MAQALINTVEVVSPEGTQLAIFEGVGMREMSMPIPGLPVLELSSALGTAMGIVFIKPGMIIKYSNERITSQQIDSVTGLVPKDEESV